MCNLVYGIMGNIPMKSSLISPGGSGGDAIYRKGLWTRDRLGWLVVAKPQLAVVISRYWFSLYPLLVELTHKTSS